jgi:hypothetical protein
MARVNARESCGIRTAVYIAARFLLPHQTLSMRDLTDTRIIKLKGFLFLFCGGLAAGLLLFDRPDLRTAALLTICVWSFCRFYYFAFYVIEHYVDPGFRFAGLGSFLRYILSRKRER